MKVFLERLRQCFFALQGYEGAAKPGWTCPTGDGAAAPTPLPLDQYVAWLQTMKGLVDSGEVDQEHCVNSLQQYFNTLKVCQGPLHVSFANLHLFLPLAFFC